jgi:hypothetical protein
MEMTVMMALSWSALVCGTYLHVHTPGAGLAWGCACGFEPGVASPWLDAFGVFDVCMQEQMQWLMVTTKLSLQAATITKHLHHALG